MNYYMVTLKISSKKNLNINNFIKSQTLLKKKNIFYLTYDWRVNLELLQYHGGTNFDRTSGEFITTSYDYDAPLDEYGN